MKEFFKQPTKGDGFDDLTTIMNWAFGYSDKTLAFPEADDVKPNMGIDPEWFMEVLAGTPGFSEINAIRLYRADTNKFDDIATLFSGISFVEMQHYDHLQELILALGGKVDDITYTNTDLAIANEQSDTPRNALNVAIKSEQDTIKEYQRIIKLCNKVKNSKTKEIAIQILNKLIADEKKHIQLLQEQLKALPNDITFTNTKPVTTKKGLKEILKSVK